MYLTRIGFDCQLITRLKIRDIYDWHQRVWECFPGRDGKKRDFLTRLEDKGGLVRVLVLSESEPTRPDWCPAEAWEGSKSISDAFFSHRGYRFELCANPTKKVKAFAADGSERRNGRREPLRSREDLVAWIRRKGEQSGFSVQQESLRTLRRGREAFEKEGRRGLHSAVEFEGILKVTDQEKFREAFSRGIGSAKAFGFGLLALEPLEGL